jgi:hypothetical protein
VIHILGYLWGAARSFFYEKDAAARAWAREQLGKILDGRARDVWIGIRRRATRLCYNPTERAGADECADYLERKRNYLDYPAFLAAGWPVASGLIEGAAKWMIKDRMEISGARWGLDGAEAVLRLRALRGNSDLDDYFTFHLEQARQRNHTSRYWPEDTPDQPGFAGSQPAAPATRSRCGLRKGSRPRCRAGRVSRACRPSEPVAASARCRPIPHRTYRRDSDEIDPCRDRRPAVRSDHATTPRRSETDHEQPTRPRSKTGSQMKDSFVGCR